MSVNRYLPHVYVLPEDDADRQLANGFHLDVQTNPRQMQVLPPANGWHNVVECFKEEYIHQMDRFQTGFLVLLIDFDERENRLAAIKAEIPERLQNRVFILGTWSEPEDLKADFGSDLEKIGQLMAHDCVNNTETIWGHKLLHHNAEELERLRANVRPILFSE